MKCLVSLTISAACMLLVQTAVRAQDCGNWSNWDLRGTYTMAGSGWIDLSKVVPTLPAGTIPMSWAGAFSYNGAGGGKGWASINAGGVQMRLDFVNLTYQMNSDCSIAVRYSAKVRELGGVTLGPDERILVVGSGPSDLQLNGIQVGSGPGTMVDLLAARRISMEYK